MQQRKPRRPGTVPRWTMQPKVHDRAFNLVTLGVTKMPSGKTYAVRRATSR